MPEDLNEDADINRLGWYFLIALGIILFLIDISNWDTERFLTSNYHSYFIGFIIGFVMSLRNQVIVDKNLFPKYFRISILIFLSLLLKQLVTTLTVSSLLAAGLPLLYLSILRLQILFLFPEYPAQHSRPVLLQFGKGEIYWSNKESGYKPSKKEKIVSYVTYISFFILFGIAIMKAR